MGYKRENEEAGFRLLTSRGGLGLVMFYLSRKRIEFAVTPDHFSRGDIWIAVQDKKYSIEVKTSRVLLKWQINVSQIHKVDFYVLVSLSEAKCFVLASDEMFNAVLNSKPIYGDIHVVDVKSLPITALNGWHRLDGSTPTRDPATVLTYTQSSRFRKSTPGIKKVRKKLADGTIKIYTYERTPWPHEQ